MGLDYVKILESFGFEFLESVLSDLTAAIIFSGLGLVFARPIASLLRKRLYHGYLLPSEAVPSIAVLDETPPGWNDAIMLVIQNNGSIALRDFRFYKCCFSFSSRTMLQINPIPCGLEVFYMDSERGGLASVRAPSDALRFDCTDSWEKRFFVEMSDAEGHIFRLTHYVSDEGEINPQGLHLVRKHLPQRRIKMLGEGRIERFRERYSLDLVSG